MSKIPFNSPWTLYIVYICMVNVQCSSFMLNIVNHKSSLVLSRTSETQNIQIRFKQTKVRDNEWYMYNTFGLKNFRKWPHILLTHMILSSSKTGHRSSSLVILEIERRRSTMMTTKKKANTNKQNKSKSFDTFHIFGRMRCACHHIDGLIQTYYIYITHMFAWILSLNLLPMITKLISRYAFR